MRHSGSLGVTGRKHAAPVTPILLSARTRPWRRLISVWRNRRASRAIVQLTFLG
jgi:hypothetical protein